MLPQLENGKLIRTLPTLARIAMVFDIGLDHFFDARRRQRIFAVVRGADRIRFPERAGVPDAAYFFECLAFAANEKSLQAYLAEFPRRVRAAESPHFHEGAEFLYVLSGTLASHYQEEETVLAGGGQRLLRRLRGPRLLGPQPDAGPRTGDHGSAEASIRIVSDNLVGTAWPSIRTIWNCSA